MELVPILSTIILVGTIATFILAVAAYILYKIRERRSGEEHPADERRPDEPHVLVQPAHRPALEARTDVPGEFAHARPRRPAGVRSRERTETEYADAFRGSGGPVQTDPARPEPVRSSAESIAGRHESLFWEYTDEGFVPVRTDAEREAGYDEEESADSDRAVWS